MCVCVCVCVCVRASVCVLCACVPGVRALSFVIVHFFALVHCQEFVSHKFNKYSKTTSLCMLRVRVCDCSLTFVLVHHLVLFSSSRLCIVKSS